MTDPTTAAEVVPALVDRYAAVLAALVRNGIDLSETGVAAYARNVDIHARLTGGARPGGDAAVGILGELAPGVEPARNDLPASKTSAYSAGGFRVYAELHPEARS